MGNNKIRHIVQVFLDIERPSGIVLTEEFVRYRIELFKKFTYRSLMSQTFPDFEIWLLCGRRHRSLTERIDLERVKVLYPIGTDVIGDTFTFSHKWPQKPTLWFQAFEDLHEDYIALTRVDSDDLLHRSAMLEISQMTKVEIRSEPKERVRLLFREYIYWDMINHFLSFQRWENPPFYTHIFQRDIYRIWPSLQEQHFNNHRFMGGGRTLELTPNKVLVTYHEQNIARIKRNKGINKYTKSRLEEFRKKGFKIIFDPRLMHKYLKEFEVMNYEGSHNSIST